MKKKYGRLTILDWPSGNCHTKVPCICTCGRSTAVRKEHLLSGATKSCGCLKIDKVIKRSTKHGEGSRGRETPEYIIWQGIRARCANLNDPYYGGRGIQLSPEWENYSNFIADMGRRPSPKHEIERVDNNKGYSKDNCKWVTRKEQANNKRNNRLLTVKGTTKTMSQWAEIARLDCRTIHRRLGLGWDSEKAIFAPKRGHGPSWKEQTTIEIKL